MNIFKDKCSKHKRYKDIGYYYIAINIDPERIY